jgi:hypothetical protein
VALLDAPSERESGLSELQKASTGLYWHWKDLLRLKSSAIRVINEMPAFIETIFGKGASSVATPIFAVFAERMAKIDALIVYIHIQQMNGHKR